MSAVVTIPMTPISGPYMITVPQNLQPSIEGAINTAATYFDQAPGLMGLQSISYIPQAGAGANNVSIPAMPKSSTGAGYLLVFGLLFVGFAMGWL